jgi:valyl-tRNA synthetase
LRSTFRFEKEKLRLKKEEERMAGEFKAITARLKDRNFTKKAPEEVVEKQKLRKLEFEGQLKKLKDNLKEIG